MCPTPTKIIVDAPAPSVEEVAQGARFTANGETYRLWFPPGRQCAEDLDSFEDCLIGVQLVDNGEVTWRFISGSYRGIDSVLTLL